MTRDSNLYAEYVQILKKELIPAMGCTEPISLAFAAAKARDVLGGTPDRVEACVSGNIIKNVKSVIVPNTDGLYGIEAAVAAGIIFGRAEKMMEVLSEASQQQKDELRSYLKETKISVSPLESEAVLDIMVTVHKQDEYAVVRLTGKHTGIIHIEKNGEVILDIGNTVPDAEAVDGDCLNVADIYDFAKTVELDDIREIIAEQIRCNTRISEEGLRGSYGGQIGKTLLDFYGEQNVAHRASAKAAAGSDARMNGCELPVVINSGSGNQGLTVSLPLIEYAKELSASEEELYRALVLANLTAIHLKRGIGVLSAYCGAVSAGVASGAGIAFLHGAGLACIGQTITNAIAIASGIVCDGAKASCAAKIAMAVDAGILGYQMAVSERNFHDGDGIVSCDVEGTIKNVARVGKEGMRETDRVILDIMTDVPASGTMA